MNIEQMISRLEAEWSIPDGFFWNLRNGDFCVQDADRVLSLLNAIEIDDADNLNRRLVELLWYIPIFMTWQEPRIVENEGDIDQYRKTMNGIFARLESILGVP